MTADKYLNELIIQYTSITCEWVDLMEDYADFEYNRVNGFETELKIQEMQETAENLSYESMRFAAMCKIYNELRKEVNSSEHESNTKQD